jgi:hypothetical protein
VYEDGSWNFYPQQRDMRRTSVVKRVLRDEVRAWRDEWYSYRGIRSDVRGIGLLGFERVRVYDAERSRPPAIRIN